MKASSSSGITRRDLATAITALPLLATSAASAQTASTPAEELAAARQQTQRNAEQLRKFKIPIATEPSFSFRP
jgi:hypothetical protein